MVQFTHLLCPVDLSEVSARPLAYADAIARWYDARLTVLHVVPSFEPMELRAGGLFDPVQIVQPPPREAVIDAVRQAVVDAGIESDRVTVAAEAGEAADTIVDQAIARRADLLVMGTHGRSGFNRLLLGSVTEKVLRKAACPVLTVPPHAAAAPAGVTFRTVVCGVDFSAPSLQAFGFALDLARRAAASVLVVHAIEWLAEEEPRELVHFNVPEIRRHLTSAAEARLAGLIEQEPDGARFAKPMVVLGRAHHELLRVASESGADLIVMGARGRGAAGLGPFGSATEQVVRAASCPVLTVHGPLMEEG